MKAASSVAAQGAALATHAGLIATADVVEATFDGTWRAILERADAEDASLIVIGARGLSAFQSFILGSVSHGVVQHASRPVLVVPPPVPAGLPDTRIEAAVAVV